MTRSLLHELRDQIADYQVKNSHLPATLPDLEEVKNRRLRVDRSGLPVDAWDRPIHYQVEGDNYDLYSLGRDGQPGGTGPDADLYAGKMNPQAECLTLWEFISKPDTGGIKMTCILAGVLAFPICLLGMKSKATARASVARTLMVHGITALFAIFAAVVISVLHLPTGH